MPNDRNSNFALVPSKPTAEMLIAGVRASGANVDAVWYVFSAMVEVARQEQAEATADTAEAWTLDSHTSL